MEGNQASVSKSMAKVGSDSVYGASMSWWMMLTAWISGSMAILYPIATHLISSPWSYFIYLGLIAWWVIFLVYLRTTTIQKHTWLRILFTIKLLTGKTIVLKYIMPLKFLQDIVPLLHVHPNGIIQFTYNYYGTIMHISSEKIDENELETYHQLVRLILDSLHDDITLTILSSSYIDHKNELKSQILDLSNMDDKSEPQKQHLNELYNEIEKDESYVIQWNIIVFVDFGKHKTLQDAEIRRQEFMPGFVDALLNTDAYATILQDQTDVALLYRKLVLVKQ
ncbi:MAG: hypothetical protein E4G94_00905 [ANME-2 cluster archaeon]|nr:MAG: hypothetical protein E4G94_00905 [ANME-2 cluster archaeon]